MPRVHDEVLDRGLRVLTADVDVLHICVGEPGSYLALQMLSLGDKADPLVSAPAPAPGGRRVVIPAIAGGLVRKGGTATHWALADSRAGKVLASAPIASPQLVNAGETFALPAFDVVLPGGAA
jgi:hypothetical protein